MRERIFTWWRGRRLDFIDNSLRPFKFSFPSLFVGVRSFPQFKPSLLPASLLLPLQQAIIQWHPSRGCQPEDVVVLSRKNTSFVALLFAGGRVAFWCIFFINLKVLYEVPDCYVNWLILWLLLKCVYHKHLPSFMCGHGLSLQEESTRRVSSVLPMWNWYNFFLLQQDGVLPVPGWEPDSQTVRLLFLLFPSGESDNTTGQEMEISTNVHH